MFRKNFLVWFVPLVFVLVIFRKFFIDRLIPMPADILVGGYYPWLDSKWGFPVSVPVRNSLPSDIISIMYPWRVLGMELIKKGILPLWDETILLGVPLFANFQASLLNPLNLLYFIFSNPVAWGIQVVLQPILCFIGMFLFLKELRLSKESSVFGGILYAFSGFAIVWLAYNTINYTLAFFPLILWAIEKILVKPRLIWGFLISLFLALQVFAGYPLNVFYTLTFASIYFVLRMSKKGLLTRLLIIGIGVFLGIAMAAIQLLPGFELSKLSIRNLDKSAIAGNVKYLPLEHLVTFFVPDYYGNPGTANYTSVGSYDNFAFFIAAPGIFFVLVSIATKEAFKRKYWVFIIFSILALLYATENPLSRLLSTTLFGLDASVNTRILFVFALSASVLAAVGFEHVWQRGLKLWQRLIPLLCYVVIVVGVALWYLHVKRVLADINIGNQNLSWPIEVYKQVIENLFANVKITFRNLAIPSGVILGTTIVSFFRKKTVLLILVSILTLYSTKVVFDKYTSFIKPDLVFPAMPVIDELKKLTGNDRFDMEEAEIFPSNVWSVYGLKAAAGQDSMGLLTTARYINLLNTQSTKDELLTRYINVKKTDSPLFDTLDISYFVALNRDVKESVPSKNGRPFPWIIPEKFKQVANIGTVRIYENTGNLGPAWFAKEVICEKDWKVAAGQLADNTYNPKDKIFVDCDTSLSSTSGLVRLVESKPDSFELGADLPKENYVAISHAIFPGWEVYVDGIKGEIKTANIALMAVKVPAGKHNLKFFYRPLAFKYGVIISIAGLGAWGVIFGWRRLRMGVA